MSLHVVAVITAKPGSEDAVREAMQALAAPGTFVTVEERNDPSDLDKHMETEHIQSALGVLGSELAAAPAIQPLKPLIVG